MGTNFKVSVVVSVETGNAVLITVVVLSDAENKGEEIGLMVTVPTEAGVNVETEVEVSVVVLINVEIEVEYEIWIVVTIPVDVITIGVGELVVIVTMEACGGV